MFHFNERVKIIDGFYKGSKGAVISICKKYPHPFFNPKYEIIEHYTLNIEGVTGFQPIKENEMEKDI